MQIAQRLAQLYEEQLGQALAAQAKELEVAAADAVAAERLQRIRAIDEARRRPPPSYHSHTSSVASRCVNAERDVQASRGLGTSSHRRLASECAATGLSQSSRDG